MNSQLLPNSFFNRNNVVQIAQELLGNILVHQDSNGQRTSGIIVETEAYAGVEDKASHAYGGRHTQRTATLYLAAGITYVYLCYGMHHLFNIVTNKPGIPHAVLIRALQPLEGISLMLQRRNQLRATSELTKGPGRATKALGITRAQNGLLLGKENNIWIERAGQLLPKGLISSGSRIGVAYAGADALLPYRFWIKNNPYVSA